MLLHKTDFSGRMLEPIFMMSHFLCTGIFLVGSILPQEAPTSSFAGLQELKEDLDITKDHGEH